MMNAYEETQSSIVATQQVDGPAISAYGVIAGSRTERFDGRLWQVDDLGEKPQMGDAPSNQAIIGRYILTPGIFSALDRAPLGAGGELELTDGMRMLLETEKLYRYKLEGIRHDAGDKLRL